MSECSGEKPALVTSKKSMETVTPVVADSDTVSWGISINWNLLSSAISDYQTQWVMLWYCFCLTNDMSECLAWECKSSFPDPALQVREKQLQVAKLIFSFSMIRLSIWVTTAPETLSSFCPKRMQPRLLCKDLHCNRTIHLVKTKLLLHLNVRLWHIDNNYCQLFPDKMGYTQVRSQC